MPKSVYLEIVPLCSKRIYTYFFETLTETLLQRSCSIALVLTKLITTKDMCYTIVVLFCEYILTGKNKHESETLILCTKHNALTSKS